MLLEKPDMNKECADKLFEFTIASKVILEWGSGGSTIAMSKLLNHGSILYSYEHDRRFYNLVKPKLDKDKVKYVFAPTKNNYVNGPVNDIHYSFILVDGKYRKECMERARFELSWDRLLLHDANRERYKPYMSIFGDNYNKYFVKNLWICEKRS